MRFIGKFVLLSTEWRHWVVEPLSNSVCRSEHWWVSAMATKSIPIYTHRYDSHLKKTSEEVLLTQNVFFLSFFTPISYGLSSGGDRDVRSLVFTMARSGIIQVWISFRDWRALGIAIWVALDASLLQSMPVCVRRVGFGKPCAEAVPKLCQTNENIPVDERERESV